MPSTATCPSNCVGGVVVATTRFFWLTGCPRFCRLFQPLPWRIVVHSSGIFFLTFGCHSSVMNFLAPARGHESHLPNAACMGLYIRDFETRKLGVFYFILLYVLPSNATSWCFGRCAQQWLRQDMVTSAALRPIPVKRA